MAAGLSHSARVSRNNRHLDTTLKRLHVRGYTGLELVKTRGEYRQLKGVTPCGRGFTYGIGWGSFSNGETVGLPSVHFDGETRAQPTWENNIGPARPTVPTHGEIFGQHVNRHLTKAERLPRTPRETIHDYYNDQD